MVGSFCSKIMQSLSICADLQIVKSFPTQFIFVRWPSQICDGTGQSTKTLGLPKSKHRKNCAGFVASLQWTSNGFQRSVTKDGQQYYIAKPYQSALQSSWMFSGCNKLGVPLFLLRDVTFFAWYFWVEWFHTQQLLKMKHLEIHSNWFDLMVKLRFSLSHVKL